MDLIIRKTSEKEFFLTENLTREAFWNIYKPGCDEHFVLHNIRKSSCYISELDLVALFENKIIGHVISTKARVVDRLDHEIEILCLGPLSVLPEIQKNGVGAALMKESILTAKDLGYPGIILFGNPDYYHRFGFRNAEEYGITTKDGQNFEPFMALELKNNGLANVRGKFFEDSVFESQPDALDEYEKKFPYKEKLVTETQLKF
jgi:predicted N-acetyltransferase YhbS